MTVRDVDWEDMVAPHAEDFLSRAQQYVVAAGVHTPTGNEPGAGVVKIFRAQIEEAIKYACEYGQKVRRELDKRFGIVQPPPDGPAGTESAPSPTDSGTPSGTSTQERPRRRQPTVQEPPAYHSESEARGEDTELPLRVAKVWADYLDAIGKGTFDHSPPRDKEVYCWLVLHRRRGADMPEFGTWSR